MHTAFGALSKSVEREAVRDLFVVRTWNWPSNDSQDQPLPNQAPAQIEQASKSLQNIFLLLKHIAVKVATQGK